MEAAAEQPRLDPVCVLQKKVTGADSSFEIEREPLLSLKLGEGGRWRVRFENCLMLLQNGNSSNKTLGAHRNPEPGHVEPEGKKPKAEKKKRRERRRTTVVNWSSYSSSSSFILLRDI